MLSEMGGFLCCLGRYNGFAGLLAMQVNLYDVLCCLIIMAALAVWTCWLCLMSVCKIYAGWLDVGYAGWHEMVAG
jgi:hypothetical protein